MLLHVITSRTSTRFPVLSRLGAVATYALIVTIAVCFALSKFNIECAIVSRGLGACSSNLKFDEKMHKFRTRKKGLWFYPLPRR